MTSDYDLESTTFNRPTGVLRSSCVYLYNVENEQPKFHAR